MEKKAPPLSDKRVIGLLCPFCSSNLEFQLNETLSQVGITYNCATCKKRFVVTRIEK